MLSFLAMFEFMIMRFNISMAIICMTTDAYSEVISDADEVTASNSSITDNGSTKVQSRGLTRKISSKTFNTM